MKIKRVGQEGISKCSWCGRRIKADAPAYSLCGRKRPGVDLTEYEGSAILISLATVPKEVICMVTAADSPAKKDGIAFIFMTCSEVCVNEMKTAMDAEIALGNALFDGLEQMRN